MGWKRWARLERHGRMQTSYLNVVVNAPWYDLIAGVIEGYSQDLVRVLKRLDGCFFPDIPQLKRHGGYKNYVQIFNNKITESCTYMYFAETQTTLLKSTFRSQNISIKKKNHGRRLVWLKHVTFLIWSKNRRKEGGWIKDFSNCLPFSCFVNTI